MGLNSTAVTQVFDDEEMAASGDATSAAIDLSMVRGDDLSIQVEITGDGIATLAYKSSLNGTDYMAFDGVSNTIKTGLTKTSGPGADGKILISFTPKPCEFIEFVATETGTSNTVTVNAWVLTR